jgi:heme exporter protein CcmD
MDLAAPHSGFVVTSYAVTLAALAVLTIVTLMRDRKLSRESTELESRKRGERK